MYRRSIALGLFGVGFGLLAKSEALALPEDRGPFTVLSFEPGPIALAGAMIPVKVYHPDDPNPRPPVAVVHGFFRSGRFMTEMAETFASWGFVALVPDMPCGIAGCVHAENAAQISALYGWAESENLAAPSPLFGRVDASRRAAVGHSWGGLGVFLATAGDPLIDTVVLLDPNDDRAEGQNAATSVLVPSAHVMAERPGLCNGTWGDTVFPSSAPPHLRVRVKGSGHCDVEEPSDSFCTVACGASDRSTTPYFRRYALAFVRCVLLADRSVADYIGGPALAADVAQQIVFDVAETDLANLPCRTTIPSVDGGAADLGFSDAGPSDSGASDRATAIDGDPGDAGAFPDAPNFADGPSLGSDAGPADTADVDAGFISDAGAGGSADAALEVAPESCGCSAQGPSPRRRAPSSAARLLPGLFVGIVLLRRAIRLRRRRSRSVQSGGPGGSKY